MKQTKIVTEEKEKSVRVRERAPVHSQWVFLRGGCVHRLPSPEFSYPHILFLCFSSAQDKFKSILLKARCIFNVSLRWPCLVPHLTEISLSSRLCPWRRFPAKPAHPQAPFLPETTQPISYPGAETWGWTKPVFLNLKAWVCISVTTSVEGVMITAFSALVCTYRFCVLLLYRLF